MVRRSALVSIGVPIFNGVNILKRSVDSLINQSYKDLEIIIVDDCSTDDSFNFIKKLYSHHPNIKIYKNNKNIGLTENCSKIFTLSSGKYFFWNAQDDFRDKYYVEKCLNLMEENPDASLCNSFTAVFYKDPQKIMHINNLNSINNKSLIERYWKLLRNYNDVNIYGFMRSEILKKTNLWLPINGSANNLLFELIILGKFIQVKETLFYYSGQSMYDRPSPIQEYNRQSRKKAFFRFPFISLVMSQIRTILKKQINIFFKFVLIILVLSDSFLVNFGKLLFRILNFFINEDKIPDFIIKFCIKLSYNNKDIKYIIQQTDDTHYYPKFYPLKKIL
jgi:glycosyltransferase involved in cell wall biosynthesis